MTARRAAALSPLNPESFRRDRHRTTEVQFLALDYKPCSPSEIACNASSKLPTPTELTMRKPRIACMAIAPTLSDSNNANIGPALGLVPAARLATLRVAAGSVNDQLTKTIGPNARHPVWSRAARAQCRGKPSPAPPRRTAKRTAV